jgi:UDP:flavonoid glycosyltransferase YjiC (YdhE family)
MASILIVTRGLPSVLYQSVELARRLTVAGHRLTFAGDPSARALVEHHGVAFERLDPDGYEPFLAEDATTPTARRLLAIGRRRTRARESLGIGAFARLVRETRPDLILVNGEMHAHIIAAAMAGTRMALLNSFVSIWRGRHPATAHAGTAGRQLVGHEGGRCAALAGPAAPEATPALVRTRASHRLRSRVGVP